MTAKPFRQLRSLLTFALMLWCAGAGCMMVSYAHGVAMSAVDATKVSSASLGHTFGSMGTHDCCKARHLREPRVASSRANRTVLSESFADLERLAEVPNSSNAIGCCPFTSGSIVVTGRQRVSNDGASAAAAVETISSVPAGFIATPLARLPNQKQTYLRGCVFLI